MNEISQFVNAVIIISLTGTISYLVWRWMVPFLEKNASRLIYLTLCQSCLLALMPVGFLMAVCIRRNRYIQGDDWWRMDFRVTGTMAVIVLVIWGIGLLRVIYLAGKAAIRRMRQWRERLVSIPEDDEDALAEFYAAKKELKVHGFVSLRRDERVQSPMTTGTIFSKVLLPILDIYTKDQFRVICYHELMHCRKHDVLLRGCVTLIGPPRALRFLGEERKYMLEEWSERHCDICAIRALKGKMTGGDYFARILDMLQQKNRQTGRYEMSCPLFDDTSRLERRIKYVETYKATNRMSKGMASLFLFSFFLVNMISAYMAGSLMVNINETFYKATERVNIRADRDGELEEMFLSGSEDNTYTKIESLENREVSSATAENGPGEETQTLSADVRYTFDGISLNQGRCVRISCTTLSKTDKVRVGLMREENGDIRFVEGIRNLSHTFTVPEDGEYSIFVQNCGNKELGVTVSYYYY